MATEPTPIRNVSDTALWVAIYRAMESERPDAIFRDPYARRLGGERGAAIVRHMPKGESFAWPMIVRTAVMDEIVLRCVKDGVRTVLNLAAGLDARPYRLELPTELRWFNVDLPDMIAYVKEHLAGETPHCRLDYVAADLTDQGQRREAFARAAAAGPVLVITEGLLIYLEAEQVAQLARELHEVPGARWWLSDIATPMLRELLEKQWGSRLAAGNAAMKFFPENGTAFFAPHGWHELEFRSTWDEALRLKRAMRGAWIFQLLSKLQPRAKREAGRRMAGVMLLERA